MGGGGGGGGGGGIVALQGHIPSTFCLSHLFANLNYEQSI